MSAATFRDVDRLLRSAFSERAALRRDGGDVAAAPLARAGLVLGLLYGVNMGLYALLGGDGISWAPWLATTLKVPLLFLLTLVVTFPSLYVVSTLAGSPLPWGRTLRLLLGAVVLGMALLASFGPVTAFFTLSTDSHPFLVLLNVVFFAAGGWASVAYLRRALRIVFEPEPPPPLPAPASPPAAPGDAGVGAAAVPHSVPPPVRFAPESAAALRVFRMWTLVYAVVGAQMSWILRPFLGEPGSPFRLFAERESNFFAGLADVVANLFR